MMARIEDFAGQARDVRALREAEEFEVQQMLLAAFREVTQKAPRRPMHEVAPLVRRPVQIDPLGSYSELGIRSFGRGTFHKPALAGLEVGNKRIFWIEPDDLLFSNVFAWEGAIAVAGPADAGRAGSHRFITCRPKPNLATSRFLCFFFLTDEGLDLIGAASPGGAGRNRTLGLAALDAIRVPVPSIERQLWFDALQAEVAGLRRLQTETNSEWNALLPAVVDRAFRGEI
jgi:type I restriction enzyme S subunit